MQGRLLTADKTERADEQGHVGNKAEEKTTIHLACSCQKPPPSAKTREQSFRSEKLVKMGFWLFAKRSTPAAFRAPARLLTFLASCPLFLCHALIAIGSVRI